MRRSVRNIVALLASPESSYPFAAPRAYIPPPPPGKVKAIGGAFMGAGGAFISLAQVGSVTHQLINGRGWVCIALIIFANWRPGWVLLGALLFGGVEALQLRLQNLGFDLPYELFLALPYVVTIIALTLAGRNASVPSAMLKPYRRE